MATWSPTRPRNTEASVRRGRPRGRARRPRGTGPRRTRGGAPPAACPTVRDGRRAWQRPPGGGAGHVLGLDVVEELEADGAAGAVVAGLQARVARGDGGDQNRVRTWSSSASSPSLLATRMRRRVGVGGETWRMAPPSARAAWSARTSSSTLAALATPSGATSTSWRRRGMPAHRRHHRGLALGPAGGGGRGLRRLVRPASVRSAVWAKPVLVPDTTRMPAPRSRPAVNSSIRPSSSRAAA